MAPARARRPLSIHTVVEYVGAIYAKLHVNTRAGAVAKAFRSGWMESPARHPAKSGTAPST